ncbi:hypothetical protein BC831DRAFT_458961 [Entophlyctis helioformis]|nr:hypothetical protein BC831DRAFT_458961 [Entophlyctis helioformis]
MQREGRSLPHHGEPPLPPTLCSPSGSTVAGVAASASQPVLAAPTPVAPSAAVAGVVLAAPSAGDAGVVNTPAANTAAYTALSTSTASTRPAASLAIAPGYGSASLACVSANAAPSGGGPDATASCGPPVLGPHGAALGSSVATTINIGAAAFGATPPATSTLHFHAAHAYANRFRKAPAVILTGSHIRPKPRPPPLPPAAVKLDDQPDADDEPSLISELIRGGGGGGAGSSTSAAAHHSGSSNGAGQGGVDPYGNFFDDIKGWDEEAGDDLVTKLINASSGAAYKYLTCDAVGNVRPGEERPISPASAVRRRPFRRKTAQQRSAVPVLRATLEDTGEESAMHGNTAAFFSMGVGAEDDEPDTPSERLQQHTGPPSEHDRQHALRAAGSAHDIASQHKDAVQSHAIDRVSLDSYDAFHAEQQLGICDRVSGSAGETVMSTGAGFLRQSQSRRAGNADSVSASSSPPDQRHAVNQSQQQQQQPRQQGGTGQSKHGAVSVARPTGVTSSGTLRPASSSQSQQPHLALSTIGKRAASAFRKQSASHHRQHPSLQADMDDPDQAELLWNASGKDSRQLRSATAESGSSRQAGRVPDASTTNANSSDSGQSDSKHRARPLTAARRDLFDPQHPDSLASPATERMALLRKKLISSATSAKVHWRSSQSASGSAGAAGADSLSLTVVTGRKYHKNDPSDKFHSGGSGSSSHNPSHGGIGSHHASGLTGSGGSSSSNSSSSINGSSSNGGNGSHGQAISARGARRSGDEGSLGLNISAYSACEKPAASLQHHSQRQAHSSYSTAAHQAHDYDDHRHSAALRRPLTASMAASSSARDNTMLPRIMSSLSSIRMASGESLLSPVVRGFGSTPSARPVSEAAPHGATPGTINATLGSPAYGHSPMQAKHGSSSFYSQDEPGLGLGGLGGLGASKTPGNESDPASSIQVDMEHLMDQRLHHVLPHSDASTWFPDAAAPTVLRHPTPPRSAASMDGYPAALQTAHSSRRIPKSASARASVQPAALQPDAIVIKPSTSRRMSGQAKERLLARGPARYGLSSMASGSSHALAASGMEGSHSKSRPSALLASTNGGHADYPSRYTGHSDHAGMGALSGHGGAPVTSGGSTISFSAQQQQLVHQQHLYTELEQNTQPPWDTSDEPAVFDLRITKAPTVGSKLGRSFREQMQMNRGSMSASGARELAQQER